MLKKEYDNKTILVSEQVMEVMKHAKSFMKVRRKSVVMKTPTAQEGEGDEGKDECPQREHGDDAEPLSWVVELPFSGQNT